MSDPLDILPTDPAAAGGLDASTTTFPSDSENYEAGDASPSPPSSSAPLILYSPPTLWGLVRGAAINLLLPFVNGLMLGFGELVANEAAFRLGWSGTKVRLCGRRVGRVWRRGCENLATDVGLDFSCWTSGLETGGSGSRDAR